VFIDPAITSRFWFSKGSALLPLSHLSEASPALVQRNARRALNEIGLSASGYCSSEQSQPRHNDLNAGIWMRAVRRAKKSIVR
jgi:hypothetical protein